MNITEKQRLVEWLNERLGLVYLGLTQFAESPGYWETYYEDEIEPLESLRALIESSSPSGNKAEGEKAVPASDRLTVPCENDPTIKKDLTVEVEEAMGKIENLLGGFGPNVFRDEFGRRIHYPRDTMAALAVIRAALAKGAGAERRYAELVEDVSRRTDQARTMEVKL